MKSFTVILARNMQADALVKRMKRIGKRLCNVPD